MYLVSLNQVLTIKSDYVTFDLSKTVLFIDFYYD